MGKKDDEKYLTVSQVCSMTSATASQLKYWDNEGVLVAGRTGEYVANNRKLYSLADVRKVEEILLYKHLGFELSQIKKILESPKEVRDALAAERTQALKEDLEHLSQKIKLSATIEALGVDEFISQSAQFGGIESLAVEYDINENLRMIAYWLKSHTSKDAQDFYSDLKESINGFEKLKDGSDWDGLQVEIAHFCDMWSKRFGWPTLGQMYVLSRAFRKEISSFEGLDVEIDKDIMHFMSDAFYLAWISGSLDVLDQIFVALYFDLLEHEGEKSISDIEEAARTLCALIGEVGNCRYLFDDERAHDEEDLAKAVDLAGAVLSVFEEAALSDELDSYLRLEEFAAVSPNSLQVAKDLIASHVSEDLENWLEETGWSEIDKCISEWTDALELEYDHLEEDAIVPFSDWVIDRYREVIDDRPTSSVSMIDERCKIERESREIFEQAKERQAFSDND